MTAAKPGASLTQLEGAYRSDPERHADRLARRYLADGRPKDAIQTLEQLASAPSAERLVLLAQGYFDDFDNAKARALLRQATAEHDLERDARAQLLLGELFFEAGDRDKAKEHLRATLRADPDRARAAELLRNLGEDVSLPVPAEAGEVQAFQTEDPDRESAGRAVLHVAIGFAVLALLFSLYLWTANRAHEAQKLARDGMMALRAADYPSLRGAAESFERALRVDDSNASALGGAAEAHALLWADHGEREAMGAAESATRRAVSAGVDKAERFAAEILLAYARGDFDAAIERARALRERGASSEQIDFALGLAQRAAGRAEAGLDTLRRAHELSGAQPAFATALGDAYDDDGDRRSARIFWQKAVQANDRYVKGAARALWGRLRSGDPAKAVAAALDDLGALKPVGPYGQAAIELVTAELAHRTGDPAAARAAIDRALELRGETPRLLAARGRYRLMAGKPREGLTDMQNAFEKNPGNLGYLYAWARAAVLSGDADQALAALASQKDERAETMRHRVALGDALWARGKLGAARKSYESVLETDTDHPEALLGVARVLWKRGKFEEARRRFEAALAARAQFPEVLESVGLMFIEMGAGQDGHEKLREAETIYLARGEDPLELLRFYDAAATALRSDPRGQAWARKRDALPSR